MSEPLDTQTNVYLSTKHPDFIRTIGSILDMKYLFNELRDSVVSFDSCIISTKIIDGNNIQRLQLLYINNDISFITQMLFPVTEQQFNKLKSSFDIITKKRLPIDIAISTECFSDTYFYNAITTILSKR
jgi:hypothetical protein